MKNQIFDGLGKLVGYTEIIGNKTYIYDNLGKILGSHDGVTNYVFDNLGKTIGKGIELLGTLLKG